MGTGVNGLKDKEPQHASPAKALLLSSLLILPDCITALVRKPALLGARLVSAGGDTIELWHATKESGGFNNRVSFAGVSWRPNLRSSPGRWANGRLHDVPVRGDSPLFFETRTTDYVL